MKCFELLLPKVCLICSRPLSFGPLCHRCQPEQPLALAGRCPKCFCPLTSAATTDCDLCALFPLPFSTTHSIWSYEGNLRNAIRVLKYDPSPKLTKWLSQQAVQSFTDHGMLRSLDLLVPIPLSPKSKRPFNQATIFAETLASALSAPVAVKALRHHGYRAPQASLSSAARLKNLRHAFSADSSQVAGLAIALVDDVATTGATAAYAALSLLHAGAISVDLITLAQSPHFMEFRGALYQSLKEFDTTAGAWNQSAPFLKNWFGSLRSYVTRNTDVRGT